jgi:hypothetical protein
MIKIPAPLEDLTDRLLRSRDPAAEDLGIALDDAIDDYYLAHLTHDLVKVAAARVRLQGAVRAARQHR